MHRTKLKKHLAHPSVDVSLLTEYSDIYKLYVRINTGLPASEAVKHFEDLVFTLFCSRLRPRRSYFHMIMVSRLAK